MSFMIPDFEKQEGNIDMICLMSPEYLSNIIHVGFPRPQRSTRDFEQQLLDMQAPIVYVLELH